MFWDMSMSTWLYVYRDTYIPLSAYASYHVSITFELIHIMHSFGYLYRFQPTLQALQAFPSCGRSIWQKMVDSPDPIVCHWNSDRRCWMLIQHEIRCIYVHSDLQIHTDNIVKLKNDTYTYIYIHVHIEYYDIYI